MGRGRFGGDDQCGRGHWSPSEELWHTKCLAVPQRFSPPQTKEMQKSLGLVKHLAQQDLPHSESPSEHRMPLRQRPC